MESMMLIAIGLATANSCILLGLVYLYSKIALKTRASYSFGLIIFALLLLSHNLMTIFAYTAMSPLFGADALPFLSAIGALEFAGLGVLFRMTLHPS